MDWQLVGHKRKGGKERSRIGENNDEMNTNQSGEEDPVEQTVFSTEGKQQRSDSAITSMKGNAPMDKGNKPNISLGSLP